jgi:hypothetical protein
VQIDLAALPDDPATLQQMLREVVSAAAQRDAELNAENDKLRLLIHRYLRHRFGPRSEQLDPDQLQLGLEDLEQEIAASESAQDADEGLGDQRNGVHRSPTGTGAAYQHICRALRSSSTLRASNVLAAAVGCTRSAKMFPRCWTSSPLSSG